MLTVLLALLQEGHAPASEATSQAGEHATEAVEHATEVTGHHAEPWLVEQVNHLLGPAVLKIEQAIMPPIYGLFGKTWHAPAPGEPVIAEHVVWAVLAFLIAVALVWFLRGKLSVDRPSRGQQLLEVTVEQLRNLLDQVIGPYGHRYLPVIGGFAVFILIGNLMGQIPGLGAPTENINVTGALGITSFIYYIATGFRQQGLKYLKHFAGGLTGATLYAMGWMIFIVELVSNSVRPVTLSLRLFVNMFADQKIGEAFLGLVAPLVPIFTIVLGLFVAFIQTFIFIMLSMVYLSETVPHEEHDHEDHGHGRDAVAEAH
ncbi:MAG TPA: F0F1 ATP synthase subunit A [Blastocatellia bacterium]|nr:F0F1 ATP synthase subunit A [Blastocatellia bacterium]